MEKIKKCDIGFTITPNYLLNDSKISLRAKGLYSYLFSKPDNWEFHLQIMAKELKESKGQIYSALKELISGGYIARKQINENGRFGGIIYEFLKPCCEKPNTDTPYTEKTAYGSTCTHNNIYIDNNTDIDNKKDNNIYNTQFCYFWEHYTPIESKDGHFVAKGSKQKTKEKYIKILKEGINHDEIIKRLFEYLTYCRQNGIQSCSAETYISQRRFENDYKCTQRVQSEFASNRGKQGDGFLAAARSFLEDPNIPDYSKLYE